MKVHGRLHDNEDTVCEQTKHKDIITKLKNIYCKNSLKFHVSKNM